MKRVVVIGGGWAGLLAGALLRRAGFDARVIEASESPGGLATSASDPDGFTFDLGAHFVTSRLVKRLGRNVEYVPVRRYGESVWTKGRSYSQPLGFLTSPRYLGSVLRARLGQFFEDSATHQPNAKAWLQREYGLPFADEIAIPLIEKWSGASAAELSSKAISEVPQGALSTVALKVAAHLTGRSIAIAYSRERSSLPWVQLVYPVGGISSLCASLIDELTDSLQLGTPVERIIVQDDKVTAVEVEGNRIDADAVVSTIPPQILARLIQGTYALEPMKAFAHRAMIFVSVKLEGRHLLPSTITWTPDREIPFFRVSEPPAAVPVLAPSGRSYITLNLGTTAGSDLWNAEDETLANVCIASIRQIVPGIEERLLGFRVSRTPFAYPVYLASYEDDRVRLSEDVPVQGLFLAGRNGEFAPLLMEDVHWRTQAMVETISRYLV